MKILENDPPLACECRLPWLINAFIYPVSLSGMIHLVFFLLVPLLFSKFMGLIESTLARHIGPASAEITEPLTIIFYVVFYAYVCFYIADCVIASSKGARRASYPTTPANFSIGDYVSQALVIVGCAAICLAPVILYYHMTKRTDSLLWILLAYGIFFLPMSLLRGIWFDSFDALNPIEIIRSICKSFFPYCGLVIFFAVVGGFIEVVLPRLAVWGFVKQTVKIYLVFVLAHRLGWFYWWYKNKLEWE